MKLPIAAIVAFFLALLLSLAMNGLQLKQQAGMAEQARLRAQADSLAMADYQRQTAHSEAMLALAKADYEKLERKYKQLAVVHTPTEGLTDQELAEIIRKQLGGNP